jgi:hypothetical protein
VTIRAIVAKSLFACFLVAAAGTAATPAAFAQHVVTDNEASKLTLDALTATPRVFVHRIAFRPARSSWTGVSARGRSRSVSMVHEASFRHSIRATGTVVRMGSHRRRRG